MMIFMLSECGLHISLMTKNSGMHLRQRRKLERVNESIVLS